MRCDECERLEEDEKRATVEFVEADREPLPDISIQGGTAEDMRLRKRKDEARKRLDKARLRRAEHERSHGLR